MKLLNRILVLAFLGTCSVLLGAGDDENPYDRTLEPAKSFHEARNLLEVGKFEKAHEIHQTMFDDLESYRPNVFLLYVYNLTYDWHRVALKHPPAMETLLGLRDRMEKQLAQLRSDEDEPSIENKIALKTVFSFNEWLGEDVRSANLFTQIEEQFPSLAEDMYFLCKDALVRAERFGTIVKYESDPGLIFRLASSVFEVSVEARPDRKAEEQKRFESSITGSMDAFWATGKNSEAEELRKLALEYSDSQTIRDHSSTSEN